MYSAVIAKALFLILCLSALNISLSAREFKKFEKVFTGVVEDPNGKPIPNAEVEISQSFDKYVVTTDKVGRFSIKLELPQTHVVISAKVPSYSNPTVKLETAYIFSDTIDMKIVMGGYPLLKNGVMKLTSENNDFSFKTAQEMTKISETVYQIDVTPKSSTFAYQVIGFGDNSRNGTVYDSLYFDGYDYVSVIKNLTPNKPFTLKIDISKLPFYNQESQIIFDSKEVQEAVWAFELMMKLTNTFYAQKYRSRDSIAEQKEYDWRMQELLETNDFGLDSRYKHFIQAQIAYANIAINGGIRMSGSYQVAEIGYDYSYFVENCQPDDLIWYSNYYLPNHIININQTNSFDKLEFLTKLIDECPYKDAVAYALTERANYYLLTLKDTLSFQKDLDELERTHQTTKSAQGFLKRYGKDRVIQKGNKIPNFSLINVNDKSAFNNSNLAKKIYLVDIWTTWCLPCVADIPFLNKAFNKYPSEKFEILSISMDQRYETIQQFTSQKHKIAWNNLWVPEGRGGKFEKEFEVTGFPETFLINEEGVIIETEGLRGERLIKTLGNYLD